MLYDQIDQLILNPPYVEPKEHWKYIPEEKKFSREQRRRPAGYITATPGRKSFDDPGIFNELPMVNAIRERVNRWREGGYQGVTGVTKRLLEHWNDPEQREGRRFFFCQLEAIETIIWMAEAPANERVGIEIPGDGGQFMRLCTKMATGTGKTIVMSMLIAWHILNKAAYPQDKRYSKHIFIVAPGLTVRERLRVLQPSAENSYYDQFNIVPPGMHDQLRQGKVLIHNWHCLMPLDPGAGPKVVKKGAESDKAFAKRVLDDMAKTENIVVINDEAHHAWRVPPKERLKDVLKEDIEEAAMWVGGLDRIHKTNKILACYDLSATPFAPTGKRNEEETLFGWIVSDFGLYDAIESGLVKTPRVVVRDDGMPDAGNYKSKLYHIYMQDGVSDDLTRRAEEHERLPDLVTNAYYLLGKDWLETKKKWDENRALVPPVMITVANRTETAARVKYSFDHGKIKIEELCAPEKTLHIDSKVLDKAEAREEAVEIKDETEEDEEDSPKKALTKVQQAEQLRRMVDTVGQAEKPGEAIQNVISVGMLSEGWDAKTVTHIMGLRAFTSQLLCEQVVGRGLRRTSYEVNPESGLLQAEYVNIFGIPFSFLPHEGGEGQPPPPPNPKTEIKPISEKARHEISWPNIVRIDYEYKPVLTLETEKLKPLVLNAAETRTIAEMAPIVGGQPAVTNLEQITLEELAARFRMQRIIFETARDVYDQMRPQWKGNREYLLAQLIKLVEKYAASGAIQIDPPLFNRDELRRRIVIMLNMGKVVQHVWEAIKCGNAQTVNLVFDPERPIRRTGDMRPWYTSKPNEYARLSHVNFCVFDSTWEASEAYALDRNDKLVDAWVKNDHLGFEILYIYEGVVRKYRPDFIIRLKDGVHLVLEVSGEATNEKRAKQQALDEWINGVNAHGGFGKWARTESRHISEIESILKRHYNTQNKADA
ncbi:MAG: DEAD/DEAH box helicase family protein [Nitrospinae bacterium]|nr:DEAD/DEAH box helicase family protein [Nitrospinota bacterium]